MKMNWGRKKSESATTASSIIGSVFPVTWINKFKKRGGNVDTSSVKEKQRGKVDFPTSNSTSPPCWRQGRFYSMDDDDAYWRLSFTGEKIEGRRSAGGLMNPLWYDSDDESHVLFSSFKSLKFRDKEVPRREESWNFNDLVLDIKKMKEKEQEEGNGIILDQRLRETSHGGSRVKGDELGKRSDEEQKDILETEQSMVQVEEQYSEPAVSNPRKQRNVSFPDWSLSSIEEDCASGRVSISEWQNFEDFKIEKVKLKNESRKKTAYRSRESHSSKAQQNIKVKVYSPRTDCKIKALEDMKKSRKILKKKVPKKQVVEGGTMFDGFAVLKNSFNPQQDFRDSMIEMMMEKEIRQTEELEELLACYLTFNCDEYHDLIIKVFRQVWFELNNPESRERPRCLLTNT